MKINVLSIVIFILTLSSCSSDKVEQSQKKPIEKQLSNTPIHTKPITELNKTAKDKTEEWKQYQQLQEFISRFKNMPIAEAFSNTDELSYLTKSLKDSITISELDVPGVRIRLNLLNNEALVLKDLASITDIQMDSLATAAMQKIVEDFSEINTRINSVYYYQKLQGDTNMSALDSLFLKDLKSLKDTTAVIEKQKKTNKKIEQKKKKDTTKKTPQRILNLIPKILKEE